MVSEPVYEEPEPELVYLPVAPEIPSLPIYIDESEPEPYSFPSFDSYNTLPHFGLEDHGLQELPPLPTTELPPIQVEQANL